MVGSDEDGPAVAEAAHRRPRAVGVGPVGAGADRHAGEGDVELFGRLPGGVAPAGCLGTGDQHEAAGRAHEVVRRDPVAVALDPGVGEPVTGAGRRGVVGAHRVSARAF